MTLSEEIKREAQQAGFQAVGISLVDSPAPSLSITKSPDHQITKFLRSRLLEWLQRGYEGTMAWMGRDPDRRADPSKVLPGCRSVISLGMNYYTEHRADEGPGHGRIARYAWGLDYHDVLRNRIKHVEQRIQALAPGVETKCYVDTGPVMEKAWAQQAGLGWIGKHSNLVSAHYGSWLLLGEILTTLDLDPDEPGTDLCGTCTLCIQSCPTGAITEPYLVDARKCISYLTIELRDGQEIPEDLAHQMGNRIFGCDDCLDACPYNINAEPTEESAFHPSPTTLAPKLENLAQMNEKNYLFTFRNSPLRRPKHAGFLRNLRIALRNLRRSSSPHPKPSPSIT